MKSSFILVAGAQGSRLTAVPQTFTCRNMDAQTCEFGILLNNSSWPAVFPETQNFISNHWEKFADAVKSVSRTDNFLQEK